MQKLPGVRRLRVQDARIGSFVSLARLFYRLRFLLSTEEQGRFLPHVRHLLFHLSTNLFHSNYSFLTFRLNQVR